MGSPLMGCTRIELADPRDFLDYREGSGGTVEIFDIQVMSDRRKGRGRKLVDILIKRLEGTDVIRIWAITRAENWIAQQFYEELNFYGVPLRGFYGVRDEFDQRTIDAVMYVRDLVRNP